MYRKLFCQFALLLVPVLYAKAQTYVFAQLKGSPMNTAGWDLQGAAKVTNVVGTGDSELLLCPAQNNQSGAAFVNQPINLSMCSTWQAEFDLRMYDGTGADGIAFCFLDVPPVGFVTGGGLGIPGTANGLKVCFDTYNNCNPNTTYEMPKVEVRWGVGYSECWSQPTAANVNGQLSFIRSPSYVHIIIAYNAGTITVTAGSLQVITAYGLPSFNFAGYLGFTSGTGGQNDNQSIKNVVIYTQMPPSVAGTVGSAVCPRDTVQLGTANDTAYSYSWSPAAGLSNANISNPYAVSSNLTDSVVYQKYFVQTSYTGSPGCASQDSVVIQVNPNPFTNFDTPVVCLPNPNVTINNTTIINDGSKLSYTWAFSDGGASTQTNPQHSYALPGNYGITLQAVSSNGCKGSPLTKNFAVSPQANATITARLQYCEDTIVGFKASTGGVPIQSWHWNFGDGGVDSVQDPSHVYTSAKTYTVSLSAVTTQGCQTDTPTVNITINPLPVAAFTWAGMPCQAQSIQFTDASKPSIDSLITWNWQFDDGTTSASQNVAHSFANYGKHNVVLTVQNSKLCTSLPDTAHLTINPMPVVSFSPPVVCLGVAGTFLDSSTIADGTGGQFTYQWQLGDGTASTASQPVHTYAAAGDYTAELMVTSNNGCKDSVSKTFAVSAYPVVDFNILTTNFCGNLPLQLNDNSSVAFATLDSLQIFWNYPATSGATVANNPVAGTVYTHNYPTFGYTNSHQVTVLVKAYSSGGCYTQQSSSSILLASPKLEFGSIPSFCANNTQPVLLNEAKDTTVFAGSGFYSGPGVSNGYFTPSEAGAGTYTITYTYSLVNSCTDSVQQTVTVYPKPTVSAGQTVIILQGGQTVLQGSASGADSLSYLWSPGATLNDSTLLQPTAKPINNTWYTLTATSSEGCFDSAGVLIKVLQYPLVPNAFSPNGDGINDTWQIAYLSSYPDCVVEVFNRYGQVIFRSQGYPTPWDGTYNGKPVPVATYYYIITTSHLPKPLSGPITVIR